MRTSLLGLAFALLVAPAIAQVTVTDPWVRGTVAGQKATGAFMQITATADATLVGVSSPAAKVVELHEMKLDGGVMRMNAVDKLLLPAGKAVELKPGGYHVMLIDLAQPLKEGDSVPITLSVLGKDGRKESLVVEAKVRALTAGAMKH